MFFKHSGCFYFILNRINFIWYWTILFTLGVSVKPASAQIPEPERKISLQYEQVALKEVIKDLTDKTFIRFSYNPKNLPLDTLISYQCYNKPTNQVFGEIFKLAGVQFEFIEGFVVLKPLVVNLEKLEPTALKPKYFTISGYITDAKNQETLIGANIFDSNSGTGTTANNYGYFSLTLPAGDYSLETSYLGYSRVTEHFRLDKNYSWNVSLQPSVSMVAEIVVSANDTNEYAFRSLAAQSEVKPFEVKKLTAALGEADMLKSLNNLPGISFQGDGSSYFYVRGGNRDQNLILLDEAPIYNPSHMFGLFTPIIPDAVKTTNIYKADFPIQFGGRLSSLVDIRTRDGNMEQFGGSASLGLVAARLTLEGPFKKQASSYFISYRRSYLGALIKSASPNIKDLFFSDFTSKLNFRLSNKNRLYLTFYNGKDKFIGQESGVAKNGLEWGNTSFTGRWNHVFGERMFMNTTLYSSRYNYFLYTDVKQNLYWNSHISGTHLKSDFTWFISPRNQFNYGLKIGTYYFNPGNYNAPGITTSYTVSPNYSNEWVLYAGNQYNLTQYLELNYGLRLTHWVDKGKAFVATYHNHEFVEYKNYAKGERYYTNNSLEPRLSCTLKTGDFSSLKASYNRTLQHINLINNSISPFNSLEVWLPSGPNIKPQKADIYDLGFSKLWPFASLEFTADIYYKKMYNQVGYSYHASTLLNPLLEGELRQGKGRAYGYELMLKKTEGRFTGQVAYSCARSFLKINGLNDNREYRAHQDKPVNFTLGIGYNIRPRWLVTMNFIYTSGLVITTPTAFYYYRGTKVPVYSRQNNDRLPYYKRVDLGCDFELSKPERKFKQHLNISFYNLLGYKNPSFVYFTKMVDGDGNLLVPTDKLNMQQQVASQRYIYSMVPSITYTVNF